jgi:hypothetical protein
MLTLPQGQANQWTNFDVRLMYTRSAALAEIMIVT